jgi:glycosyltransferase involved in cell wall biosynthesis
MKVLMASWSWEPVGGDWTYINNVKTLYENNGYEVIPFSTYVEGKTEKRDHFVKAYDYKNLNSNKGIFNGLKAMKNSVISFEALKNIDAILDEHEISFAHLHIIHHWLTPAIIWRLKKRNIPVIWSLHEYKIICPEGSFVSNGTVCEKCINGKFYNCAVNRCKKGSFAASALASIDAYYYHRSGVYKKVDAYLCPSEFLQKKFVQYGFPAGKMHLSNLCYDISIVDEFIRMYKEVHSSEKSQYEKFILYVGRIEKIKGIDTLIKAVEGTGVRLKIAGTGAYFEEMSAYLKSRNIKNVEILGFQDKKAVFELTMQAAFVVCPSEWYENYPYSVIESLLFSKPVVGAEIGGIPELVLDGKTGFLHKPGDSQDLQRKILQLWENDELVVNLGIEARKHALSRVNFERHWKILENIIDNLTFMKD